MICVQTGCHPVSVPAGGMRAADVRWSAPPGTTNPHTVNTRRAVTPRTRLPRRLPARVSAERVVRAAFAPTSPAATAAAGRTKAIIHFAPAASAAPAAPALLAPTFILLSSAVVVFSKAALLLATEAAALATTIPPPVRIRFLLPVHIHTLGAELRAADRLEPPRLNP